HQKTSRDDVHVLGPPAKKMRRIGSAQIVAIIRHVLAEVVGEIVPAVVALAAGDIRANHDPVANLERDALEVRVVAVSSNCRNRSDIFVALNDWETDLLAFAGSRVLCSKSLVRVF